MRYKVEEITSKNITKEYVKEIAECMRTVQWHNERGFYLDNLEFMGYQGFGIPSEEEYQEHIKAAINETSSKIFLAKETCCGNNPVGLSIVSLTNYIPEAQYRRGGRVVFFWVHPKFRKTNLLKELYKHVWGFFRRRKCINISLNVKHFQSDIAKFFLQKGYKINNMELVGPTKKMVGKA